ncbi:MAG: hypothetical protein GX484_05300 [Chloroflexi bacterium]|nr:hypothetical protein [Chloroflexota bacterium]
MEHEVILKKVDKLRRAALQRPPGEMYVKVYWRDVLDVCDFVEHVTGTLSKWSRRLSRNGK